MNATSWFRALGSYFFAGRHQATRSKSFRRPERPRLYLERLEDRVVPTVGTNFLGSVYNPTFQFGPSTTFTVVSTPNVSGQANAQGGGLNVIGAGQGNPTAFALGYSAVNSLGHEAGDFMSLFAASSVNSVGGSVNNSAAFASAAFGFGSGTQPGAPWAPAAYNVGLGNHQLAYPSIADQGFQSTPPWARNIAHHNQKEDKATDDNPKVEEEQSTQPLAPALAEQLRKDGILDESDSENEDVGEEGAMLPRPDGVVLVRTATLTEAKRETKTASVVHQTALNPLFVDFTATATGVRRGEPEVEESLFAPAVRDQHRMRKGHDASEAALFSLGENPLLATLESTSDEWTTVRERVTESPLLLGAALGLLSIPIHCPAEDRETKDEESGPKRPSC